MENVVNDIPKRIPADELKDWAQKSIDCYLEYPLSNLGQEFNYWRNLTASDIQLWPEKAHHLAIYSMCVFTNKLPTGLRMSETSGRNYTSLDGGERKWLEGYFFQNKDKILNQVENYVYEKIATTSGTE